jgi:rod shape-determining protein MreD
VILNILSYFLRFAGLLLLQLLVINNIELSSYINPYIYVAFILLLPVNTKPWHVVIISFLVGATVDAFSSTPGLHIAATNFMGFVRIHYLRATTTKEDQEGRVIPSLSQKGIVWFCVYGFVMILLHHIPLFFLEIYGFHEFFDTFSRVVLSTLVTLLLIIVGQLLFFRTQKSNG